MIQDVRLEKQLSNVGFIKTILMCMVILGHACDFWTGNWFTENPVFQSQGLSAFAGWLNSFHIFAFALASGYIFAFKILGGGYRKYFKFLQNKAKRLLVPYVFSMLIWVVPVSVYFFDWTAGDLFKKYILCINPSQLWFLWMLFGVFAIIWPMKKIMLEGSVIGWGISIVFYGIGIVGEFILPNVFCIWTACQYVIFFYIGMRIRVKSEKAESLMTERVRWYIWLVLDMILFVGSLWIDGQDGYIMKAVSLGLRLLLHIVGAIMAWSVLQILAEHIHWNNSKAFNLLSAYSMPMYLFHQQIIYFVITALNGAVNPWINAVANFAVATLGSFVISAVLMKWKDTRFLIEEK